MNTAPSPAVPSAPDGARAGAGSSSLARPDRADPFPVVRGGLRLAAMSPLAIRRYRAERLLQAEFRQLQARVIGVVRRRVGATGVVLDEVDLEACYALAWQGLYAAMLEGQEISNPTGWLVLATYRRAIDEQRARLRAERGMRQECSQEPDLAGSLDDRDRLRELFEGLCTRMDGQERQAAVLCYLHGFTRSEAAAHMGISERRMRRLMEGRGPGRPGVSEKLGELATSIREGRWCEQQGSLMRGLAFGILDRDGERYRLAVAHSAKCSSCRAYVASLRGLGSVLPPVLLPGGVGASILSRVGEGAGAAAAHTGAAAAHRAGRSAAGPRRHSEAGGCSAGRAPREPVGPGADGSSREVPSGRSWWPAACWRWAWVRAAWASAAWGCRRATMHATRLTRWVEASGGRDSRPTV